MQTKRYFFWVKVHLLVTKEGVPIELCFVPGSEHDIEGLRKMNLELPPESSLYGDSAYTEYELEKPFRETELVDLKISRKANSLKPDKPWQAFLKTAMRKKVETSISEIVELTPQFIHAVTAAGFLIKLLLLIMAYQLKTII